MSRIIPAFMQFFDDNGDPLVNGWLRFTVSGTNNTDKATYADNDETIANTNPVQLDGAGRCPNVFGTGSYNVRSYTNTGGAPGVQIQQFDPVGGIDAGGQFSEWLSATIYGTGNIVIGSNDKYYRSLVASNQNNDPTISPQQWEEVQLVGAYNQYITYAAGEIALDTNGYLYRSLQAENLNKTPAANPDWWGEAILQTDLIANTLTHNMTADADYTFTASENRYGRAVITDSGVLLTAARNIIVSTTQREFFVLNSTAQTLTFKTLSGTGIAVIAGASQRLYCDGTNVIVGPQVQTAQIADSSVTYAKLSSEVSPWVTIATATPSAVASVDLVNGVGGVVLDATYDEYRLAVDHLVPVTDAVTPYITLSEDAGSTWVTALTVYGRFAPSGAVTLTGGGFSPTDGDNVGNLAGEGITFSMILTNPSSADRMKHMALLERSIWIDETGADFQLVGGSYYARDVAWDGIQVRFSAGNIASGAITLQGRRV